MYWHEDMPLGVINGVASVAYQDPSPLPIVLQTHLLHLVRRGSGERLSNFSNHCVFENIPLDHSKYTRHTEHCFFAFGAGSLAILANGLGPIVMATPGLLFLWPHGTLRQSKQHLLYSDRRVHEVEAILRIKLLRELISCSRGVTSVSI
jgi:hypothetical protein